MKKFLIYTIYSLLIFSTPLLFTQCKKVDGANDYHDGSTILHFSVLGIQSDGSANFKSGVSKDSSKIQALEHKDYDGFETLSYIEADEMQSPSFRSSTQRDSLVSGVKYRVELFEVVGGNENYVTTLNLESGAIGQSRDTVRVAEGKDYKWYAYSYNTSDAITLPNGQLNVAIGENKDFVYDSGTIDNKVLGRTSVDIVFKRKTARVAIDIDARGLNADAITGMSVTVPKTIFKTGNIDLKNGEVTANNNYLTGDYVLNFDDFENVDGDGNNYRKVAYLHSADAITPNTLYEVSGLQYTTSNGIAAEAVIPYGPLAATTFTFTGTSIPLGNSRSLKANFLAKGIDYRGGSWAPANLYRHDLGPSHRYRFYPHNNQTTDYRTFFSFGGIEPLRFTGVGGVRNNVIDACALVYPKGRWMTPNRQSFSGMVGSSGLVTNILQFLLDILVGVNQANTTAVYSPYPMAKINYTVPNGQQWSPLSFPMNKYLPSLALVGINETPIDPLLALNLFQLAPGDLTSVGSLEYYNSAHLWTGDELIDLDLLGLNILDVGSQSYLGIIKEEVNFLSPEKRKAAVTSDLTNISALGAIKILKSNFKNIRCVRNNSWDPNAVGYDPNPVYNINDTYLPEQLLDLGIQL